MYLENLHCVSNLPASVCAVHEVNATVGGHARTHGHDELLPRHHPLSGRLLPTLLRSAHHGDYNRQQQPRPLAICYPRGRGNTCLYYFMLFISLIVCSIALLTHKAGFTSYKLGWLSAITLCKITLMVPTNETLQTFSLIVTESNGIPTSCQ